MRQRNNSQDKDARAKRVSLIVIIVVIAALLVFCYLAKYPLILPLLLLLLGIHLSLVEKVDWRLFTHFGFLLTFLIFTVHVVQQYTTIQNYYLPVAGFVMLTMLLFNDLHLAFMMSFLGSFLATSLLGGGFGMFLIFFSGGLIGAYGVRNARTRGQLIKASLFVSMMHLICVVLLYPHASNFLSQSLLKTVVYPLIANGFISIFLVKATLKIFETLFGVLTNYSLLELSDFNQPLLKRMILEAPGTYHHSLVVSNMSEAAADAIGANALLTRVGSYYHDIGKMLKPEYFTENQMLGGNKHDKIEPSMSRLVILNHVKEGIELARRSRLNPLIIDFIPQHHGTSLIYYFYQKSLTEAAKGESVDEATFRYPGPKPQKRETAITLLADSVEAATRALGDPNPKSIEETVKKIINNKFIDGQLDECNLTLKEINKISLVFTRILNSMYHSRIKYPEKKNGSSSQPIVKNPDAEKPSADKERAAAKNGNHDQKSSEKNAPSSRPNKEDNPEHPSS